MFSTLEILENRCMLSASGHSATETVHSHGGKGLHVEMEHANKSEVNSGKFRVKNDDPAGHDANDDKGVDPVGHDANDDKGVDPIGHDANDDKGHDAVEVHQQKGRGKGK
jgi:hypothetical protein